MFKLLKSRKAKIITAVVMSAFVFVTLSTSVAAWFSTGTGITFGDDTDKVPLKAGAEASHFARGSGTENDPYIINDRIHLYNLAWLQYVGEFNTSKVVDPDTEEPVIDPNTGEQQLTENIRQLYFKIDLTGTGKTELDMSGITLPPIGTETYPFYGNFDGNGYTITNLTVSNDNPRNDSSDFGVMKPTTIQSLAQQPNVVGFFGVVGKLPNAKVDIDSSINELTNFNLLDVTVQSRTSSVLIGLAAGYTSGTMNQVTIDGDSDIKLNKVNNANPTAYTALSQKISEYGLVGHTTSPGSTGVYRQDISKYYNSEDDSQGGGDDWGGHVDLDSVYKRLYAIENKAGTYHSYPYVTRDSYLNSTTVMEDSVATQSVNFRRYSYKDEEEVTDDISFIGNFSFGTDSGGATYKGATVNDNGKIYLEGGHYANRYYYIQNDNTQDTGYYITDGSHYLRVVETVGNNGSSTFNFGNTNDVNQASIWHIPAEGSTGKIYSNYYSESTLLISTLYLARNNNNALTLSTADSGNNSWTIAKETVGTTDYLKITSYNTTYQLVYYNNAWTLRQNGWGDLNTNNPDPVDFYVIQSGTRYMSAPTGNDSSWQSTTDINSAAQVKIDGSNVYSTTTTGTTKYYLAVYTNNSGTTISNRYWTSRTTSRYKRFVYSNDVLSVAVNNTAYYLRYNNGWTTDTTNRSIGLTPVGHTTLRLSYTLSSAISKPFRQLSTAQSPNPSAHMEFTDDDTTYFPINAYKQDTYDGEQLVGRQYEPTMKNTGYFVSGTTLPSYATGSSNDGRSFVVSNYERDKKIGKSLSGDELDEDNVRTVDSTGTLTSISDLAEGTLHRYYDEGTGDDKVLGSKTKFEMVLDDNPRVCGLHFITKNSDRENFAIGKQNVVNATNVKILGEEYSSRKPKKYYQLPAYSVDFNLKEQGYINFFAGTYNGGTNDHDGITSQTGANYINAFFSLHRVFRDSNGDISDIKEIKGIYTKSGSTNYFYTYKSYTPGSSNNAYTVVSDDISIPSGSSYTSLEAYLSSSESIYTRVFDTDWIGYYSNQALQQSNTLGHLFYFEIPVNQGEYCLANVCHGTSVVEGAYLIYLDIGASGNEDSETIKGYTITTYSSAVLFPTGVDFAIASLTASSVGGETICVYIPSGTSGVLSFSVGHSGGDTIEVDDTLTTKSTYGYVSSGSGNTFTIVNTTTDPPPNAYVTPENNLTVTRTSYIFVELANVNHTQYYITVTDVLVWDSDKGKYVIATDENDNPMSTYVLGSTEIDIDELNEDVKGADYYISRIRGLVLAISLIRNDNSFTQTFNASLPDLPWTNDSKIYIITVTVPEGYEILVSSATDVYTVVINEDSDIELVYNEDTGNYEYVYVEPAP